MIPKSNPVRSASYLAFVRTHSCAACCASGPSLAHHFMEGKGGMGTKVSDTFCVPLCRLCHDFWHQHRFLPCFQPTEKSGYEIAVAKSRALQYQAQSELLDRWIRLSGVWELPRDAASTF